MNMYSLLDMGFPDGSVVKSLPASVGDVGSVLRSGRSPGDGNGNPLQYSCLENFVDRNFEGSMGVAKSQTQLSN